MAWLKAYEWERKLYPWQRKVLVRPEIRQSVAEKLWGVVGLKSRPRVYLTTRGGAWASYNPFNPHIKLPTAKHPCTLGTVLHELAHIYNRERFGNKGHRGTFKKAVIHCYVESRAHLKRVFQESLREAQDRVVSQQQKQRVLQEAETRRLERKRLSQTGPAKMERTRQRIRRLETRVKRLNTLLKKARRSLSALERHHGGAGENLFGLQKAS